MQSSFTRVSPARPPAPYVGGKRNLAKRVIARLEAIPHEVYAEVFVGMGGIFLRRAQRPAGEIINDYSGDVANLFRILQRHYPQFMDELRFGVTARREFDRQMRVDPTTLTDLERAHRFLYLQNAAFGGKVTGRTLGVSFGRPARFDLTRLAGVLEDLHGRLSGVTIEQMDFEAFLGRYDRPGTLFYCDPPYWGTEDYYGAELFSRADFQRLADALRRLKGRFLLSLNDTPEVREIFGWAAIEAVDLKYGLAAAGATEAKELLISN